MNHPALQTSDGRPVALERMIGRGGEGEVFTIVGDKNSAVKLYTASDGADRERKVAAMVRAKLSNATSLVAFPVDIVRSKQGHFAGFIMRLVSNHRPVHELYAPGSRKQHFPNADYRFLARTATNTARAFAAVHRAGCIVGDINHSVVLVSDSAVVALIDADSFQFSEGKTRFLCRVGTPEYTPPELQGRALTSIERTSNHDAFGIAVLIFQILLMGRHPFVGTVRQGEIPPLHDNIAAFRYAYAENRNVGMDQPPGTPALFDFSPDLAKYFDHAFSSHGVTGRPSAEQWVALLEQFETTLTRCGTNSLHYAPRGASECPWCEMEKQYGTALFLPPYIADVPPSASSTRSAIDIDALWRQISSIRLPTPEQVRPKLRTATRSASAAATRAKEPIVSSDPAGWWVVGIGAILCVAVPALIVLWALVIWGGISAAKKKTSSRDNSAFISEYADLVNEWNSRAQHWVAGAPTDAAWQLKEDLENLCHEYRESVLDDSALVARYKSERRERQLIAFLESFFISNATIKGVGPSKLATLASYGINTAADVTKARIVAVPGFGPSNSEGLLDWRASLERRFVYNPNDNEIDRRELARMRTSNQARATHLTEKLSSGLRTLTIQARALSEYVDKGDATLDELYERIQQAKVDIEHLGLRLPSKPQIEVPAKQKPKRAQRNSSARAAAPKSSAGALPRQTAPTPSARPTVSIPTCPRCNGAMTQRLAKRGRNAGSYFWGCLRYPRCKGTRPV